MERVKKIERFFRKVKKCARDIFNDFPITMILIILATTFIAMVTYNKYVDGIMTKLAQEKLIIFLVCTAIGDLLVETLFNKKGNKDKPLKVILMILSGFIAVSAVHIGMLKSNTLLYNLFSRLFASYLIILGILIIYFNYKKSKLDFNQYFLRVFVNLMKATIIYVIAAIGIFGVTAVFEKLILDANAMRNQGLMRVEIGVIGYLYIPLIIKSIVNVKEDYSKFVKHLSTHVVLPLVLVTYGIIYVYMAKILVFTQIPSNSVFRILTALFIISYAIERFNKNYSDSKFVNEMNRLLPVFFVPLLFLQLYVLSLRTKYYGLTPLRYIAYFTIIFEVITIILDKYNNGEYCDKVFIVFATMLIISNNIPGINMYRLSALSQYSIIKGEIRVENPSNEDLRKLYGAYTYLINNKEYETYIIKNLTDEEKAKVDEYNNKNYLYNYNKNSDFYAEYTDLYSTSKENKVNIADYSSMQYVETYQAEQENVPVDLKNVTFQNRYNTEHFEFNVEEYVNEYLKSYNDLYKGEFKESTLSNRIIKLNDKQDLYVETISIKYNITAKKIKSINITGMLFDRK